MAQLSANHRSAKAKRFITVVAMLALLLTAVWGWCYRGWYQDWHREQQVLQELKIAPPNYADYQPIVSPWLRRCFGPGGFALDRVRGIDLSKRADITDLSPLVRLSNLHFLFLDGTKVTDLSPLTHLTTLYQLDLRRTPVTDITPLLTVRSLNQVVLPNGIPDAQVKTLRRALPGCYIEKYPVP